MKIERSFALQERAKNRIPGLSQLLSKRPDMFSYGVWPAYYSKASGAEIWDLDDNRYIDMSIGGIGANILGYADPEVDEAVIDVVRKGSSSSLNCPEDVELADLLCELHPWAEKVRYTRSGGEAMTVAIRIARAYTGKDKVTFCGYHGWHDWYLSANLKSADALGEQLMPGLDPIGVPKALAGTAIPFVFNDSRRLREIVENDPDVGTIVIEPIRNEKPNEEFIETLRELQRRPNLCLIADEISAGFRLNKGGSHLLYGIEPDIAVFSKALGNGYPIAAVIGKSEVLESAQNTFISSTQWTERIGPTAALATLTKIIRENIPPHLVDIGGKVQEGWLEAAKRHKLEIEAGGIEPLSHFAIVHPQASELKALFIQEMLERGFLASTIFYAMYAHTADHVSSYLAAVDEAFAVLQNAIKNDNVKTLLKGRPSSAGFKRLN